MCLFYLYIFYELILLSSIFFLGDCSVLFLLMFVLNILRFLQLLVEFTCTRFIWVNSLSLKSYLLFCSEVISGKFYLIKIYVSKTILFTFPSLFLYVWIMISFLSTFSLYLKSVLSEDLYFLSLLLSCVLLFPLFRVSIVLLGFPQCQDFCLVV